MTQQPEDIYSFHPKSAEYEEFFRRSVNSDCYNCTYLTNFTVEFALKVLEKAAVLDKLGSSIVHINEAIEEEALLTYQQKLLAIVNQCDGPETYLTDVEAIKQDIRTAFAGDPVAIEKQIARIPLTTDECTLQKKRKAAQE